MTPAILTVPTGTYPDSRKVGHIGGNMKTSALLLLLLSIITLSGCSSSSTDTPAMKVVSTSVTVSSKAETPAVNNSEIRTIALTFSEKLDANSIADGVKLYKVNAAGDMTSENCLINIDPAAPNILNVSKKDGTRLTLGEKYKLVISSKMKSGSGATIGNDFVGYFSANYLTNLAGAATAELSARSIIICISDIHLGDKRSIDGGYGWFNKNREALVSFLTQVRVAPNVRELVIAGDMFDEWLAPMATDTLNGLTQSGFVDSIATENQAIIDAFNSIIKEGKIKVTYVTGNHDMQVTSVDVQRILPGISEARDAQGLGAYSPLDHPEILIEHGHRYDFYNAPDPISNSTITTYKDAILPLGFFVTKIGASILGIGSAAGFVPDPTIAPWSENQYMAQLPVTGIFNSKIINTGIDGYTDVYSVSDLIPHKTPDGSFDVTLYKGVVSTWPLRQMKNKVPVKITPTDAIKVGLIMADLDAQATTQYFQNADSVKRIVVFGHSHIPLMLAATNTKLEQTIYANSGTWIDNATTSMTFVAIIPPQTNGSATDVKLYQYSQTGITALDSKSVTILK